MPSATVAVNPSRLETSITSPPHSIVTIHIYIMKAQAVARVAGAGVLLAAGAHAEVAFKVPLSHSALCHFELTHSPPR
jgi:hypothetical protein